MSILDQLNIEMPCDIGAEQSVLGAILLSPETSFETLNIARESLQGNEFYNKSHMKIFSRMVALQESEQPVDLITLTNRLTENKELEEIGGMTYLSELAKSVPTAANIEYYINIVKNKHVSRQSIEMSISLLDQARTQGDTKAFVTSAEMAIANLSDQTAEKKEFATIREALMNVFEKVEHRHLMRKENNGITGISSGYPDLDSMTAGFQQEDLIIVAARPSVGKTAFALNVGQNIGTRHNESVAIFSLEMSTERLVERMMCAESNIDAGRMRTGMLEGDDWEKMTMAIGSLSEGKIFIDDSPGITVSEIRAKCRRLKKEKGLRVVIIDYLQLIQSPRKSGMNREQEVAQISRTLKLMARELGITVIALSQLSRGVEQRQDKRPMLSDLRESGSIEQDADIVAFLYRDDYYNQESEKKNIIEIIIAKQRNGPVGTVELVFMKNINKFVNLDHGYQSSERSEEAVRRERQYG